MLSLPCWIVHGVVDQRVDGVDDEGDDPQAQASRHPLPCVLSDQGEGSTQTNQGGGA